MSWCLKGDVGPGSSAGSDAASTPTPAMAPGRSRVAVSCSVEWEQQPLPLCLSPLCRRAVDVKVLRGDRRTLWSPA